MSECHVFAPADLLPAAWRALAADGPVRTFNPALLATGDSWLLAYRVVLADGRRRLAFCRLDSLLRPVEGSVYPFSDHVRFPASSPYPEVARTWLADPRLYTWNQRCFVYWNSGWHEPRNYQFLQEFDPVTWAPAGPPRELVLDGARQPLEKNWTLFTEGNDLRVVYSAVPHRILALSLDGEGDLRCREIARTDWSLSAYPACHGGLRGGAPPVWHDGRFWSFCHSVHDGPNGYCYVANAYCFGPGPDFRPTAEPVRGLDLGLPFRRSRTFPRLNPAVDEVIYPCGAVRVGSDWWISHGINDEGCAVSRVSAAEVEATLRPRSA
ncbi:MAG: hypothetical protein HZC55_05055 [Verrucomicrobia bacterium]|nr:hypothetical protein [Verrucomicrobiota bacterium]